MLKSKIKIRPLLAAFNFKMEKKYLVVLQINVADEGDVGLIQVLNESELNEVKSIDLGFGNIEEDSQPFDRSDAEEITEEEYKVLKKLGLTDLHFGYCSLSKNQIFEDEDDEL